MGDAWHQSLFQRGQRVFTSGGCIRLTTDPAGPVHQRHRVAVAVLPQRPTNHSDRPPATADAAQLSASPTNTTGGAAAGPLRTGPPGRQAAAAVPDLEVPYRVLERSTHFFLQEMGVGTDKVSTLRLKAARTPADTEPAKLPRRGRPVAQAPTVRAPPPTQRGQPRQVTFNLPPTMPPTTSITSTSGRPLRNGRLPNRLNL
jgi:hypothetical protein